MDARRRTELVLLGRFAEAEVDAPTFDIEDLRRAADWAREVAGRPRMTPPPKHIATRHRVSLVDRLPAGAANDEVCDPERRRIWYRWCQDQRAVGRRIYHGVAHCVLFDLGWTEHSEADVILLETELVWPASRVSYVRLSDAIRLQQHAPTWQIAAQFRFVLAERRAA